MLRSSIICRKWSFDIWRHQYVEPICSGGYDHSRYLWMPMNFFQVFLTLHIERIRCSIYVLLVRFYSNALFRKSLTWWTKRSCGGRSAGAFTCSFVLALNSASSSSSLSRERSHILRMNVMEIVKFKFKIHGTTENWHDISHVEVSYVSWLSDDDTAKVEASCGLHSMDVMGCLWYSKCATTGSSLSNLRSRIENVPSSLPDASMQLARLVKEISNVNRDTRKLIIYIEFNKGCHLKHLFHVITFTSALCALIETAGDFPRRVSQIAILPSTEHEAKTYGSVGLHCKEVKETIKIEQRASFSSFWTSSHRNGNAMCTCKSSTLAVWPTKGLASTFHVESDAGSHRWIEFLQSPGVTKA